MSKMKSVDSSKTKLTSTYIAIMIPLGAAINLIGGQVAGNLKLPIFLDSIGTAIVAAVMGPWIGSISGILYNIISALIGGNILGSLFGLCNVATALIVGYMVRYNKFENIFHAVIATILTGLANAVIGAPIAVIVYGGIQGSGVDIFTAGMLSLGQDIMTAAFVARIPVNLVDKGIAVLIAFLILKRLPENLKSLSGRVAKTNK